MRRGSEKEGGRRPSFSAGQTVMSLSKTECMAGSRVGRANPQAVGAPLHSQVWFLGGRTWNTFSKCGSHAIPPPPPPFPWEPETSGLLAKDAGSPAPFRISGNKRMEL